MPKISERYLRAGECHSGSDSRRSSRPPTVTLNMVIMEKRKEKKKKKKERGGVASSALAPRFLLKTPSVEIQLKKKGFNKQVNVGAGLDF